MIKTVHEKIRMIATQVGVAAPESDEQIYSISFFGSIERRIRKLYEGYGQLNNELIASKAREKELEDTIRNLIESKQLGNWEESVDIAKSKLNNY